MKRFLPLILLLFVGNVMCGEITEQYWVDGINPFLNKHIRYVTHHTLYVTYYQDQSPSKNIICTVFDQKGQAIMVGEERSGGYVAHLSFHLKEKYRHQELELKCD